MKLTKSKLQQIIKEELNEIGVPFSDTGLGVPGSKGSVADPHTVALNALEDYIAENYGADTKLIDLMQKAQEAVADFENPLQEVLGEGDMRQQLAKALKQSARVVARPVTSRLRTTIPDNPRLELPPVVPQDLGPEDEPREPNQEPSSQFPPHIDRAMDVLARIPEEQYNKLMANQEVLSFALNQFGPVYDSGMSSDEVYRQIKHLYQALLP